MVSNVSALAILDSDANRQASIDVDLMGTMRLVQAAMPHLEASDAASIVTISSVSGREVDFASGPYGTVKTAILGYTQGLAFQLAAKGIRANSVSPGNTYFTGGVWASIETGDPELFDTAMGLNPTGRMGTPAEMAAGGDLPDEPRFELHHGREPADRRGSDSRYPAVAGRAREPARRRRRAGPYRSRTRYRGHVTAADPGAVRGTRRPRTRSEMNAMDLTGLRRTGRRAW